MTQIIKIPVSEFSGDSPVRQLNTLGNETDIGLTDNVDITGGTLTVEFTQKGSNIFQTPVPENTIDLTAPESINITGAKLGKVRLTLTGFTGTAKYIKLVVNSSNM